MQREKTQFFRIRHSTDRIPFITFHIITVGVFLKKSLHNASFIYIKTNVYIKPIK